jgi:hypothetical protein
MEEEIWKPVKGYEGLYEVSNLGKVRKYGTNILSVFCRDNKNVVEVQLTKNKIDKCCTLAKLVIATFKNATPLLLSYKDGNKYNCSLTNLLFVEKVICCSCGKEDNRQLMRVKDDFNYICKKCFMVKYARDRYVSGYEKHKEREKTYSQIQRNNLSDSYIKSTLVADVLKGAEICIKHKDVTKEMIEAKRIILKLKRICRQ